MAPGLSQDDLVRRTLELVEIASETKDEAVICDVVEARLRACPGWSVSRVGHSLAARAGGPSGRPLVALVGHLDTVSPRGPNPPRVEGDRLFGLGASDMKGGLALMLGLAEVPTPSGPYELALVFYDAEEGPYEESGLGPLLDEVGWLADCAIAFVLEPTDNRFQLGCLGTAHARVTFRGQAAHSARPWHGHNAIHAAAPLLARLAALAPHEVRFGDIVYREVISATTAGGGHRRNVVPDAFTLNLNYRFAPGRDEAHVRRYVEALVADEADVHFEEICPSAPVPDGHPLLARFRELTPLEAEAKQAWTDVARLAARGIPAVNLGPGATAEAHQPNESISIEALVEGDRMFRRFLADGGGG